jgi:acyl-coenzyme A synthetase/AMP-(fatty) acid ligase
MHIDFLLDVFNENRDNDAIIWRDETYTYGQLVEAIADWVDRLKKEGVEPGTTVSLEADFSPNAVALLLALIERSCVVVPLTSSVEAKKPEFRSIAEIETIIDVDANDNATFSQTGVEATHEYLVALKDSSRPGLILFSSGSTGASKASVHDFVPLLEKFKTRRHSKRSITFLLFDHIGGVNTLLYNLSNAGCVIALQDRAPDAVLAAIERHRGQLLPTSPTFINLVLLSEAYKRHNI